MRIIDSIKEETKINKQKLKNVIQENISRKKK